MRRSRGLGDVYKRQPFDHRDTPRAHATQIGFGQLTRAQQLMGIGYLYVEEQLQTLV